MTEYFMSAKVNEHGIRYKLTRNGRSMRWSTVNLYIEGRLHSIHKSAIDARKVGRSITGQEAAHVLTEPDKVVALAARHGHGGVGTGHYCEFYIAPANRLANTGYASKGRAIMQAGMDKGHVAWPQMAAWEDFVKYTESEDAKQCINS